MKFSILIAVLSFIFSFSNLEAQEIKLDNLTGSWFDSSFNETRIFPNQEIIFNVRFVNTSGRNLSGLNNGFQVFGPSTFTPTTIIEIHPEFTTYFDLLLESNSYSADGVGADTVGIRVAAIFRTGLPDGFNDIALKIKTGGVVEGETLCIDSSYYKQCTWKWAYPGASIFPDWGGPYCFEAKTPCYPPQIINASVSLNGSHCDAITYDFDADSSNVVWSASIGTIDANGLWSYAPSLADVGQSIVLTVTATGGCDTSVDVNLIFTNEAPVIECSMSGGDISSGMATTFQISASDDCDSLTYSIYSNVNASGSSIDPHTGELSIIPDAAGLYEVSIEVSDGDLTSSCDVNGSVVCCRFYSVEIGCVGDQSNTFVYQGQHVRVPISNKSGTRIDGYDLLISYDNSALNFQSATPGVDIVADGWEYFTYRYGANGTCGSACSDGLVRVIAIAETNNGPNHPIIDGVVELAVLDFLVTNDRTLECQSIPVRFFWMDCGDNTFSTDGGNTLLVSERVLDGDEILFPPNGMEIQDFNYGFPTYFGTQDECIVPQADKPVPYRQITFNNGCVNIACADSIDARGDINLNNIANEIADAVLLSNYFVYGLGVFNVNLEGQIAATDVNADGLSLSVADLVYLTRVIIGDAVPYPKLHQQVIPVKIINNKLSIETRVGAALIQLEGDASFEILTTNMEIIAEYDMNEDLTKIFIFSLEGHNFTGDFLHTNDKVFSIELATPQGAVVNSKIIPNEYALSQNYPNPFNPSTTIEFSLAKSERITISIFNINGQKVAEYAGEYEPGKNSFIWDASDMSSGVYFYKLITSNYSETKKMVLLK